MIRVALHGTFGTMSVPDILKDKIDKNKNYRLEMARLIDELPCIGQGDICDLTESLLNLEIPYFKRKYNCVVSFYYKLPNDEFPEGIDMIRVESVDNTKPWRIVDYDGVESVEYFKGVTVLDEVTNESNW